MSMLIFIEDNKRNECGESFLENLKVLKFLHSFIWYSMHNMIIKHVSSNMIFPKYETHRVHEHLQMLRKAWEE